MVKKCAVQRTRCSISESYDCRPEYVLTSRVLHSRYYRIFTTFPSTATSKTCLPLVSGTPLVVCAGGRFVHQSLKEGIYNVFASTGPQSFSPIPSGLHSACKADHETPNELAAAMQGQDVTIITSLQLSCLDERRRCGRHRVRHSQLTGYRPRSKSALARISCSQKAEPDCV